MSHGLSNSNWPSYPLGKWVPAEQQPWLRWWGVTGKYGAIRPQNNGDFMCRSALGSDFAEGACDWTGPGISHYVCQYGTAFE